jgi:hypothetical protein
MNRRSILFKASLISVAWLALHPGSGTAQTSAENPANTPDLWPLAQNYQNVHRFSTLFTAQNVRDNLSSDSGLQQAMAWCKATAITHVYVETFRDGYRADRNVLLHAKDQFLKAGFRVSGCVTPTQVGKASTGWKPTISCYTDQATQEKLQNIFEFTAGLFDEIMIDDFWFTDCECPDCNTARQAKTVLVGSQRYPVSGDAWEDYRCELMTHLSQDRILAPARKINPQVKIIIKYPQWYDRFHDRGYEVARETSAFDRIWVGTETRDYADSRWGGTVQYEAYFIMRWLGGIGDEKCGGGWYDWLGTTEKTYVEQARQTVLGGARESLLFCYGGLLSSTGPNDVRALRQNLPELFQVASEVARRKIVGIAAYKPINSHPEKESRVFDFVGMLGLPLVPCHQFPTNAPAAFFSVHSLKDPDFPAQLRAFIKSGKPVLITDGLQSRLGNALPAQAPNVQVLPVQGDPKSLLKLTPDQLSQIRPALLKPFQIRFQAPNQVAFYGFTDGSWVVENFNDQAVQVELNGEPQTIAARSWKYTWK